MRGDNMETDYIVTDEVKKLWATEIEIYKYFDAFCKKHNFKYYAVGGTALGAARHKGFIPWDDDMDFVMFHEDYQRFLELGAKEFTYPYFLASHITDPVNGGITTSRLRRLDTTACSKWEYDYIVSSGNCDYKLGIWIDILPLSYIPEDEETRIVQRAQIMDVWKAVRGFNALQAVNANNDNFNHEYLNYIDDFKRYNEKYSIGEIKQLYLDLCGQNKEPTKFVGVTALRTFLPKLIWETKWFESTVDMPFENVTVPCPVGWNEMLTKQYGDWRIPVRNLAFHEIYKFSADVPYKEMFKEFYKTETNQR